VEYNPNTQSYQPKRTKKTSPKKTAFLALIAVIVIAAIIFFTAFSPFVTIPTGHTGVVTVFGRVEDYTYGEGFHVKNPWARVIVMDNRTQKQSLSLQAFSSDIQQVDVIATVNFNIARETSPKLYQGVGLAYYEQIMMPRIQESIKAVFARYSAEKLIGARATLASQVMEILVPEMEAYGIVITAISIENVDFTDAFTDAVEAKQVAEQTKLKTEIEQAQQIIVAQTSAQERQILAEADATVRQIEADAEAYAVRVRAEAEAAANALIAASLTDALVQYKEISQWDGALPSVYGGASNTLPVLDVMEVIE